MAKSRDVYGVDRSDIEPGNLAEMLDRIAHRQLMCFSLIWRSVHGPSKISTDKLTPGNGFLRLLTTTGSPAQNVSR